MRLYLPASATDLRTLRDGDAVTLPGVQAESDDEEDEYAALQEAAGSGPVVLVAELDGPDVPVTLDRVEAFHVDADGSGDLAWYAVQEIGAVLDLMP